MLNKRRYKFTKQIAIAALLFSSSPLYAETQTIYGFSLEFRLTEGGSGQYNELLEEFKKEGLDFKLQIIPLKRAMRKFFRTNNESNCIFPTSLNAISKVEPNLDISSFLISEPADQISLRIFTRANSPVISDISELHGVKVALWNGLDPNLFLKGLDAKIENTPNELIRVKMLNANRIDAILGFTPDVILAAQKLNLPEPHFDGNLALFRDEGASLACKKSEKNIKFIDQYNVILKKLKANGRLNEILGPHIDLTP